MTYDVVGSLCENNDKFAVNRELPEIVPGDIVVIHDAGAHGHAMGFNYNGKLRSAEFLFGRDNAFRMIRRAETVGDYFAALEFGGSFCTARDGDLSGRYRTVAAATAKPRASGALNAS